MKTITTGIEFYQMLTKHIELPPTEDRVKMILATEEFSKIIVNSKEINIDREKTFAIYQEMLEIYQVPSFVEKLEISFTADSMVTLKFESVLLFKTTQSNP